MKTAILNVMKTLPALVALLLGACASVPSGPSVLVLPGTGKNFEQFRADDADCRQYANLQLGGNTPNEIAGDSGEDGDHQNFVPCRFEFRCRFV